jgi:hypothetical protein
MAYWNIDDLSLGNSDLKEYSIIVVNIKLMSFSTVELAYKDVL